MYKIYLLPEDIYLSNFDIGLHLNKVRLLKEQLFNLKKEENQLQPDLYSREYSDLSEVDKCKLLRKRAELTTKIITLNTNIREVEETAKNTIGLVNSKDKAEKAIKYYRNIIDSTYLTCEFIIMKAKL